MTMADEPRDTTTPSPAATGSDAGVPDVGLPPHEPARDIFHSETLLPIKGVASVVPMDVDSPQLAPAEPKKKASAPTFKPLPQIPQMRVPPSLPKEEPAAAAPAPTPKTPAELQAAVAALAPTGMVLQQTAPAPVVPTPAPTPAPAVPIPVPETPAPPAPVIASLIPPDAEQMPAPPTPASSPTAPALAAPQPPAAATSVPPVMAMPKTPIDAPREAPAVSAGKPADFAHFLEEVKLPERQSARGSADAPQKGIPLMPPKQAAGPAAIITPQPPAAAIPGITLPPAALGAQRPVPDAPAAPKTKEQEGQPISSIHTLRQDLQHVVRDDNVSLVHAAALEQDRKRVKEIAPPPTPAARSRTRRSVGLLFATFLFFFLGVAALFGVYVVMQQQTAPLEHVSGTSLIFAEQEVALPLDNAAPASLRATLGKARNTQTGALGSITRVVPLFNTTLTDGTVTQRPATLAEFLKALAIEPPPELMRALGSDFFLGLHTIDKTAPVIVIPVSAYDRAFSGMLDWEPRMNADFAPLFTAVSPTTVDAGGIPSIRTFGDYVLRNYDVRALKDDQGTIQLYYSFPVPNLLVIAESPYTFTELLSRLQASRRL